MDTSKDLAINKVLLLYIFKKIDFKISGNQITRLVLENKLMNYFLFQQLISELCNDNFIKKDLSESKTVYSITSEGEKTLDCLFSILPEGVKSCIDIIIPEFKIKLKNETLIEAEYFSDNEDEYMVNLKINEDNFPLINLTLAVGTKVEAKSICDGWKKNAQLIYSEIIDSLIKKRD